MIPDQPSSSGEPPKPIKLGPVAKIGDHHEADDEFWELDGELAPNKPESSIQKTEANAFIKGEAPNSQTSGADAAHQPRPVPAPEHVQADIKQDAHRRRSAKLNVPLAAPSADFDPLDEDGHLPAPVDGQLPAQKKEESIVAAHYAEKLLAPEVPFEQPIDEKSEEEKSEREKVRREAFESGVSGFLGFCIGWLRRLSLLEKACWITILVGVSGFAIFVFLPALDKLPQEKEMAEVRDFPISGSLFKVTDAKTYWRQPVEQGPDADVFRRGTVLLPAIELKLQGGPAAIRVIYRDGEGRPVGDTITEEITSSGVYEIAGTAGFQQLGDFAAYHSGQTEPWTVEVMEASSVDAPPENFTVIFEMNLSAIRN